MPIGSGGDSDTHFTPIIAAPGSDGVSSSAPSSPQGVQLPDWLRSLTVGRFAPYRAFCLTVPGGVPTPIVLPNPMRVGLIITVPPTLVGGLYLTIADAEPCHRLFTLTAGQTLPMTLAEYFSLVTTGLVANAVNDVTLAVTEFARPC